MNQKGVTLVEVLVTLLLMTLITPVIISLVNLSITTQKEVVINNGLQREARFIVEQVTDKVRNNGEEITASYEKSNKKILFSDGSIISVGSGEEVKKIDLLPLTSFESVYGYDLELILVHSESKKEYVLNTKILLTNRIRY